MTQPNSLKAYAECEEHFEQALAEAKGIAVTLPTKELATRYAQKLNTYRVNLRKLSKRIREPADPEYNTSPFDHLKVSKDPENPCRILITRYETVVVKVETL